MNCLRLSARRVHSLSIVPKRGQIAKAGSPLRSQFHKGLATHSPTTGVSLASETRPVTKVEKIILDTIKVGWFRLSNYSVE